MKMNKQQNAWLKSLRRLDLANKNIDYMRVCSAHFKSGKPAKYHIRSRLVYNIKYGLLCY